jgi:hypothetical protein
LSKSRVFTYRQFYTLVVTAALMACGISTASADTYFTENFNSYQGGADASQQDTGYTVEAFGNVTGWSKGGGNALHAVETSTGDWTIMLYYDNSITLDSGIAGSNVAGQQYVVSFDYGTGNYAYLGQGTTADVGVTLEVFTGEDLLAEQTFIPGAWGANGNDYDLQAGLVGSVAYTGDGAGDVRLAFFNTNGTSGSFGGSIDNISLSDTPEPGGFFLAGPVLAGLAFLKMRRGRA